MAGSSATDPSGPTGAAASDGGLSLAPPLDPTTRVELRSRFDRQWTSGFEVVDHGVDGYRLRRMSDGAELPGRFPRDDVRRERRRGQWWY